MSEDESVIPHEIEDLASPDVSVAVSVANDDNNSVLKNVLSTSTSTQKSNTSGMFAEFETYHNDGDEPMEVGTSGFDPLTLKLPAGTVVSKKFVTTVPGNCYSINC